MMLYVHNGRRGYMIDMNRCLAALLSLLTVFSLGAALAEPLPLGEDADIGELPGKQWELHSLTKTAVTKVSQITGENTENKTQSRFGVWGVDLGSMAVIGDTTYMFGGDTFGDENHGRWRSNVLFLIQDDNPSDGLTIVDAIRDKRGVAKELLVSLKLDWLEMTVIPTNLFAVDDTLYCIYMSVSHWGDQAAGMLVFGPSRRTLAGMDKAEGEWPDLTLSDRQLP